MQVFEKTLSKWDQIHDFSKTGWIFRGQPRARWTLETSLERCFRRHGIGAQRQADVESDLIREFRRAYHHYASHVPRPEDILEWLALMRHHGAPTRLLDFSYSVYVAAYFAVEGMDAEEDDAAVWAVDGAWALDEAAKAFAREGRLTEDVQLLRDRFVEGSESVVMRLFFDKMMPIACPLNPFRLNERVRTQKGLFLAAGASDIPFDVNFAALPGHDREEFVVKLIIPRAMGRTALEHLFRMNITRASLFPGLDGYAQSLGIHHPSFERDGMFWYASRPKSDPE